MAIPPAAAPVQIQHGVTCAWCASVRARAGLAPRVIATSSADDSHGICGPCGLAFCSGLRPLAIVGELAVYGLDGRLKARAS